VREDGLTELEGEVADHLFSANEAFTDLPVEHEDDQREFEYHVHMLQGLLAVRVARRAYPGGWLNTQLEDPPPCPEISSGL
jgi:hypothetical protein